MANYGLTDLVLAGVRWELKSPLLKGENRLANANEVPCEHNDLVESSFNSSDSAIKQESPSTTKFASAEPTPCSLTGCPPLTMGIDTTTTISANTAAANAANTADELCNAIRASAHPLSQFANFVGPRFTDNESRITIITDVPSMDDDMSGQILSGAAGDMVTKMLTAIGIDMVNVSVIPLVFWRTPGGRTPTRNELDLARPFVLRALELATKQTPNEHIIITLGALSAAEIAGAKLPADLGKPVECSLISAKCIPIWHPNYMTLKPESKRAVWDALQNLQKTLTTAD